MSWADLHVAMVLQRFRPWFSGQGMQVEDLCRALARRGVRSTIVVASAPGAPAEERHDGYRVVRVPVPTPEAGGRLRSPIFGVRAALHLLREPAVDLFHVHAQTDALYTAWLVSRVRRRPLLFEMTLLGEDDPAAAASRRQLLASARLAIYRRADGYVAISPALAEASANAGLAHDRVRMIPQGVDLDRFGPAKDRAAARAALGLPADGPLLLFVGSLVERKGIDLALHAFAGIHAKLPAVRFALAGPDRFPNEPASERFLADTLAGLPPDTAARIHRLGLVERVEDVMAAADVFVFPSRREGFGTVIVEAMASGLPAVVAEMPGITDFIFESAAPRRPLAQADGFVVPKNNAGALARAVLTVLDDAEGARAMAERGRRRASAVFGFDAIADAYVDWYGELIRRRGSGGAPGAAA